ncbi:MAG: DUF1492 domain-containing protein [Clostridiales bacterium]|nr:DUF1492 domain-containing protein [Clostridiales bacterium]
MNKHQVEAKNYLSQAFRLNQSIDNKMKQLWELRDMAAKTSVTYSDMPGDPNRGKSKVESCVAKIADIEAEIDKEIDGLIDLKLDIMKRINEVSSPELQAVLDLRYLKFMNWNDIAKELGYGSRNVYLLHGKALDEIRIPESLQ